MKINKILKNQDGFSVVQIVIAAGMVGVVSMGIIQTMKTSSQITKKAAQDFEINRMVSKMESILKDSAVCRSTFYGKQPAGNGSDYNGGPQRVDSIILRDNVDTVNTWEGATPDIDSTEYTAFSALPIKDTFLRADCPETGTPPNYPEQAPCVVGRGSNSMVLVKEIKILAFESTHSTSGRSHSVYNNESNEATVEFIVKKGISIGKNLDGMSDKDKQKLRELSFGNLEIPVRFPVLVSLDNNGRITNCAAKLKDYYDEVCVDMFDGIVDKAGNLKCKNITLYNVTTPLVPTALIVNGDLNVLPQVAHGALPLVQLGDQKVSKRVLVGTDPGGTTVDGSLGLGGHATVKDDVTLNRGEVYFGPLSGTPPTGQTTKLEATADRELTISGVGGASTVAEGRLKLGTGTLMQGRAGRIGINNSNPTSTLDVTGNARFSGDLTVNGQTKAKAQFIIGDTVKATFKIVNGKLRITGANVEIYQKNDQWEATGQTSTSLYKDYVAKRGWVWRLFDTRLGSTDAKNGVIDAILNFGGAQALGDLRSQICARMRRGSSVSGSWNGLTCDLLVNSLCSGNQGLYGFNSSGTKLCRNVRLLNSSCGTNQVASGINANGSVRCTNISYNIKNAVEAKITQ